MASGWKGGIEIPEPDRGRPQRFQSQPLAGMLFFIAGAQFLVLTTVAESLYPNYSIRDNFLSDLGVGPSATIWNTSIFLAGMLFALGAYPFLFRGSPGRRWFTVLYLLAGAGAMGTGVFNENAFPIPHQIVSFMAFVVGGIVAIVSYKLIQGPFRVLSIVLGLATLSSIVLWNVGFGAFGNGLMERMVAFPEVIWLIAFGGYLMGVRPTNVQARPSGQDRSKENPL